MVGVLQRFVAQSCRAGRETVLDPDDRVLGYVFLEDLDVNVELVCSGLAFPYLFDSLSTAMQQRLRQEAQSASAAALGLWRDYTPLPPEAQPAREPFSDDPGPVNFPAFWRRWVEYRSGGGEPGPSFVEFVRAGRDRALSVPLGERRLFSDLIDPLTNRLLVNPWEPVFAEDPPEDSP
jgi:hypothetical protein